MHFLGVQLCEMVSVSEVERETTHRFICYTKTTHALSRKFANVLGSFGGWPALKLTRVGYVTIIGGHLDLCFFLFLGIFIFFFFLEN